MEEIKFDRLEYIRNVFMGFTAETKDNVLSVARSLLEIQEGNIALRKHPNHKKNSITFNDQRGKV